MSCGYLLLANGKWKSPELRYLCKSPKSTVTSSSNSSNSERDSSGPGAKVERCRLKKIMDDEENADDQVCLQSSPGPHLCHTLSSSPSGHHEALHGSARHNQAESSSPHANAPAPVDRLNGIYFGLLLAGVGFLLPYNSFVIAVDYFQDHFPGTPIMFDISFVYIISACLAVFINNLLVDVVPLYWRINFGYILSFGTLMAVATLEIAFSPFTQATNYSLILAAVGIIAFGCTIQQSSFYGYTSMLPTRYTQAVMTGESAAGLIVSINRIITKLVFSDERINTLLFFGLSIGLIGCCMIIHNRLQKTSFVRYYLTLCSKSRPMAEGAAERSNIEMDTGKVRDKHESDPGRGQSESLSLIDYLETDQRSISILGTTLVPLGSAIMSEGDANKKRWVAHSDSTEFSMPFGIDEEDLANYVPPVLPEPSWKRAVPRSSDVSTSTTLTSKKTFISSISDKEKWKIGNNNDLNDPVSWTSDGDLIEEQIADDVKLQVTPPTFSSVTFKESSSSHIFKAYDLRSICNRHQWQTCKKRFIDGTQVRLQITRSIWPCMLSICMAYLVTLSLFPGIEAEITNCSLTTWTPVILMATFNFTDFIGKIVASFAYNLNSFHLILISSFRFVLIPCFALCVAPRSAPVFQSIFWSLLFTSLLGLTNGIVGSLPMIIAPSRVNFKSKELTGNLMTLSYSIGLTTGSALAYLIDYLLGPIETASNLCTQANLFDE